MQKLLINVHLQKNLLNSVYVCIYSGILLLLLLFWNNVYKYFELITCLNYSVSSTAHRPVLPHDTMLLRYQPSLCVHPSARHSVHHMVVWYQNG